MTSFWALRVNLFAGWYQTVMALKAYTAFRLTAAVLPRSSFSS